jgi:hypothetical protein
VIGTVDFRYGSAPAAGTARAAAAMGADEDHPAIEARARGQESTAPSGLASRRASSSQPSGEPPIEPRPPHHFFDKATTTVVLSVASVLPVVEVATKRTCSFVFAPTASAEIVKPCGSS